MSETISKSNSATATMEPTSLFLDADPLWTSLAPRKLALLKFEDVHDAEAISWQDYLDSRKTPRCPEILLGKQSFLDCGLPATISEKLVGLQYKLASPGAAGNKPGGVEDLARDWQRRWRDAEVQSSLDWVLEALCWAYRLPSLSGVLSSQTWWSLCQTIWELATHKDSIDLEDVEFDSLVDQSEADDLALQQLALGELPLVLALLFPELAPLVDGGAAARALLSQGIIAFTDGEGVLHGNLYHRSRLLFACWTRCATLAKANRDLPWSDEAQLQYEWMVLQNIRLLRTDGTQLLLPAPEGDWHTGLLRASLDCGGDTADRAAAEKSLPKSLGIDAKSKSLPDPSFNSEWASTALLRCDWKRKSPRAAVRYAGDGIHLEVSTNGHSIIEGPVSTELRVDGKNISLPHAWEEVCWDSDDDIDYLELSLDLWEGARIDRQFMLAREDRAFIWIDNLVLDETRDIEFDTRCPLVPGITYRGEPKTRDGVFTYDEKPLVAALPLSLAEWRSQPCQGEMQDQQGMLVNRIQRRTQRLCQAVFMDLATQRVEKPRTWRQLTVAESLRICDPAEAAGFRVQIGKAQWLFYRSLAAPSNRTLLGQNLVSEFLFARFEKSGEIEKLIEIEG